MPLLFSYGTLQEAPVQMSTFGRRLHGDADALIGFEPARAGPHANVIPSERSDSRVAGTVFEVTDAELAAADRFEAQFSYKRVAIALASGRTAWVYVHDLIAAIRARAADPETRTDQSEGRFRISQTPWRR